MTSLDELNNSLQVLSLEEQEAIRNVLEKDLEFQQMEQNRIRSLSTCVQNRKSSIIDKRRASSVAGSTSSESGLSSPGNVSHGRTSPLPKWNNRICSICQSSLGYILNSGTKCKKCAAHLCDKCACLITTNPSQKYHLCPICYSERELSAAKNEWVQGSDEMTSEKLLNVMQSAGKRNSVQIMGSNQPTNRGSRAPYKRNLTLPAIQTNFLLVPLEAQGSLTSGQGSPKFWGGSPSPRSPKSLPSTNSSMNNVYDTTPSSDSLRAVHPREPIGSPAPRPMSSTPLTGVPEDEGKMDTVSIPPVERRRSAFEESRREPRKFVEAVLQFDRKVSCLSVHILIVRNERDRRKKMTNIDEFMHLEVEFRQKCNNTTLRHKTEKRRTSGEEIEKVNEVFKFPRISESILFDARLKILCVISMPNSNQKSFEGTIKLKELVGMKNGTKQFKFVELGNIELYSIEEEEIEQYDWIISV